MNQNESEGNAVKLVLSKNDFQRHRADKLCQLLQRDKTDVDAEDGDVVRLLRKTHCYLEADYHRGWTGLHYAIHQNDIAITKILLEAGADPNRRCFKLDALQLAINDDNFQMVQLLLSFGAVVNVKSRSRKRAMLNRAVQSDNAELAEFFIRKLDHDFNEKDIKGNIPLLLASAAGNASAVRLLLQRGADREARDAGEHDAFYLAAWKNHADVLLVLLEDLSSRQFHRRQGSTRQFDVYPNVIFSALASRQSCEIIQKLLETASPDELHQKNSCNHTLLHMAFIKNNSEAIMVVIRKLDYDFNEKDIEGNTPLLLASAAGNASAVRLLLQRGADREARDAGDRDAFYLAAWKNHADVLIVLLEDLNYRQFYRRQGSTRQFDVYPNVIFSALASHQSCEIIQKLLKTASPDELQQRNVYNQTLLHMAVLKNNSDAITAVRNYTDDEHTADLFDQTPVSITTNQRNVKVLLKLIAPNNGKTSAKPKNCIYVALLTNIKNGHAENLTALVKVGVPIHGNHVRAAIDLEDSEFYKIEETNYDLEFGYRLEDSILGIILRRGDRENCKLALHYSMQKKRYKTIHRLYYAGICKREPEQSKLLEDIGTERLYIFMSNIQKYVRDIPIIEINLDNILEKIDYSFAEFLLTFSHYWINNLDYDEIGPKGETPLQKAVQLGKENAAAVLLQHGAEPRFDSRQLDNYREICSDHFYKFILKISPPKVPSLLMLCRIAVKRNLTNIRKKWIFSFRKEIYFNLEYNINETNEDGYSALHLAASKGLVDIASFLLENGANINLRTLNMDTALHLAIENGNFELIDFFLNNGADSRLVNEKLETPLILAVRNPGPEVVELLIKHDPDLIDATDDCLKTALFYAVVNNNYGAIEILIQAKASLTVENYKYSYIFHVACSMSDWKTIRLLLENGADARRLTERRQTSLIIAADSLCAHDEVIARLLKAAPELVNAQDDIEMTPLHYLAMERNSGACIEALLNNGADINLMNGEGDTALHKASFQSIAETVSLLLKYGANPYLLNRQLRTPLMLAVIGNIHVIDVIDTINIINLLKNADPNVIDAEDYLGMTALSYAQENNNSVIIKALDKNYCPFSDLVEITASTTRETSQDVKNNERDHLLLCEVETKNYDNVEHLLNSGADVNLTNDNRDTILHIASREGETDLVSLLLKRGADPQLLNNNLQTPLISAASNSGDQMGVLSLLLEAAWDVIDFADDEGMTALHYVVKEKHFQSMVYFLDVGANADFKNRDGDNVLHIAIDNGDVEVVSLLLQRTTEPLQLNKKLQTPLILASTKSDIDINIIYMLVAADPQSINATDKSRMTALHYATKNGHHALINLLIDICVDPNIFNEDGDAVLHIASRTGNVLTVSLLLEYSADPRLLNGKGQTPLMLAASRSKVGADIINLLIEVAQDLINDKDCVGMTALHYAVKENIYENVVALLNRNALVDIANDEGNSALHIAIVNEDIKTVTLLLETGADPTLRNKKSQTPLILTALFVVCIEVVDAIIKAAPGSIDDVDDEGMSALHYATMANYTDLIDTLKIHHANFNLHNNDGDTALHIASAEADPRTETLLLEHGADPRILNKKMQTSLMLTTFKPSTDTVVFDSIATAAPDTIDAVDDEGMTALHYAAINNNYIIIDALKFHNANFNIKNKNGDTALHVASVESEAFTVSRLLKLGADPRLLNDKSQTSLGVAVVSPASSKGVIDMLIAATRDAIDIKDNEGMGVLHCAITNPNLALISLFLENGADPRLLTNNKETPLILAAKQPTTCVKIVTILIEAAPDVIDATDADGKTALFHLAINLSYSKKLEAASNLIDLLLMNKADPNIKNVDGDTILHFASSVGDPIGVSKWLQHGANPRQLNSKLQTPLMSAAMNTYDEGGVADIIYTLLEAARDTIDAKDDDGMTALHHAVKELSFWAVLVLLKSGADVGVKNNEGNSPLHVASLTGDAGAVNILLKFGANPRDLNEKLQTPIMLASFEPYENMININYGQMDWPIDINDAQIFADFLDNNVDGNRLIMDISPIKSLIAVAPDIVNAKDVDGMTVLHYAAVNNNFVNIRVLVNGGINLNIENNEGNTALHITRKSKITKLLLEHGADPRHLNKRLQTPLMLTSVDESANTLVVNLLVDAAPELINSADEIGLTALHHAAIHNNFSNLGMLLDGEANPAIKDIDGNAVLHIACMHADSYIISLLLKTGANPRQLNKKFQTPLMLFCCGDYNAPSVLQLLVDAAPDIINAADDKRWTALHFAVFENDLDYTNILLEGGVKINLKNIDGNSALHLATMNSYQQLVSLLLEYGADTMLKNNENQTPLKVATSNSDTSSDIINLLETATAQ